MKRKKSSSSTPSTPTLGDSLPVKLSTAGLDCATPATVGMSQSPLPQLPQRSAPPPLNETSDPLRSSSLSRAGTPQHQQQTKQSAALIASDEECDRLRAALVISQDATVVQLLLEFCLPSEEEKLSVAKNFIGFLSELAKTLKDAIVWAAFLIRLLHGLVDLSVLFVSRACREI
ncbi:unnamed protein product [Dibothriocephalus latus]|uniref:Uncharacterized protein n=1 Tax=Dibothriocephalus latus TaxID=60516 RepID=A0A3P6SLU3_DIBLA|nr:unnamed protein product [Dibothriocephalus latus]